MNMSNMMYLMFGPGRNISGKKFGQMFFWQCLKCLKHAIFNVQCQMSTLPKTNPTSYSKCHPTVSILLRAPYVALVATVSAHVLTYTLHQTASGKASACLMMKMAMIAVRRPVVRFRKRETPHYAYMFSRSNISP